MGLISAHLGSGLRADASFVRAVDHPSFPSDGGSVSSSGIRVTETVALEHSPVWACVNRVAKVVASLPLIVYRRTGDGGRERAYDYPLYRVLNQQPNRWQTPHTFKLQMQTYALLWGNAHARILLGPDGHPEELWPIHPDSVTVDQLDSGDLRYRVRRARGGEDVYPGEDILHIPGLTLNGISGLSVMHFARNSIGVGTAAGRYGASLMRQGARLSGFIKYPGSLSVEGQQNLRESFSSRHSGVDNMHRVGVLEAGVEWVNTGMTAQDSEVINLLHWSVADVARHFDVPLHLIHETSASTSWGSGLMELGDAFIKLSLQSWLTAWEDAIQMRCIAEPDTYFPEFLLENFLRHSLKERADIYTKMIGTGVYCPDDVRRVENLPPLPDGLGQKFYIPVNLEEVGAKADKADLALTAPEPIPFPGREDEGEAEPAAARAHYELLLHDAAARVIRREVAAMTKAAARAASDRDAWREAVADFYGDHADFVAETMRVSRDASLRYCLEQMRVLLADGVKVMADWETVRTVDLVALALERAKAAA